MPENINDYVFINQLSHIKAVILSAIESATKSREYDRYVQTANLLYAADYMLANMINDYDNFAIDAERSERPIAPAPSEEKSS